jgi:Cu/Ag efflux pump CusA
MVGSVLAAVLRFRLLLVGIAAAVLVLGVISLRQMHVDAVPELASGPVLNVQTEALGLSSQEVEQYVTVPLENNLLDGIMGVWDVRSNSLPGLSSVNLYFQPGTTLLHARQLVQERLTNAFSLPNISKPPQLIQPLSSTSRVMLIGLSSNKLDPLELSYLARWIVKPRLSGVPGVANVAIFGQQDRQIQVLADPARLATRHVTLQQIVDTAGNSQLVSPLSYLEGAAPGTGGFLDGPNQRLDIRPVLPLGAPRDLAAVPISGAAGKLPLGSVTTVVKGSQPMIGDAFVNGTRGLVLEVQKLPSASVLGVTHGLEQALTELRPSMRGVSIDSSIFRPAGYTSNTLHNLGLALLAGAVLALVALVALFFEARSVVIAVVSIEVSMLAAALLLQALAYTLNALVILGLLVAAAVVVDDAVSGTHAIVARVRARAATGVRQPISTLVSESCSELRSTLGYGTLIALLTAAPVFFSKGLTATFVHPMLLAFSLAVLTSTVVALTLTPALGMLLFDRGRLRPRHERLSRAVGAGYHKVLGRALAIPRAPLLALCAVGLVGIVAVPFLSEPAPPSFRDRNLVVQWDGPVGTGLTEMNRITQRVIGELRALPAVGKVGATVGRAVSADQIVDANSGQLYVTLRPNANYDRGLAAVKGIVESTPGMHAGVSTYESNVIGGVLAPAQHAVDVRIYGDDYKVLNGLANRMVSLISHVQGVGIPEVAQPTQQANIEVTVNDAQAAKAGVLPGDARRQVSTLLQGLAVGNFFVDQAVFDVVVRGVPGAGASVSTIRELLIDTSGGGHVPLRDIAQVSVKPDPVNIRHEALSRYLDVTAPVYGRSVAAAQADVQSELSSFNYPLQYHAEIVGGTPEDPTSSAAFLSYVAAAAIGVLLLLQAAIGSWRLAGLLFLLLPVSLSGGLVVALATGHWSSLGADAGLLAVFAFAARQELLLAARIRRLREQDGDPLDRELVLRAASNRLAPASWAVVVLAALLVPFVVLGNVAGNELTHVAAAVILGGVVSSTLLNLLVVPAVCLAFGSRAPVAVAEIAEEAPGWPEPTASHS